MSKLPRLSKTPRPADSTAESGNAEQPGQPARSAFCDQCGGALRAGARFCDRCGAAVGRGAGPADGMLGAEIWISVVGGILFLLIGITFGRYLLAQIRGQEFHTGVVWNTPEKAGQEVGYWELEGYTAYTDAGTFGFVAVLLLDAAALLVAARGTRLRRPLIGGALVLTLSVVLFNGVVAAKLLGIGLMPIMSVLIIGLGGFMAFSQWRLVSARACG